MTNDTFALGSTTIKARHVGGHARFIQKNESFSGHAGLLFTPTLARLLHVDAFLLACVQGFF